MDNNEQVVR